MTVLRASSILRVMTRIQEVLGPEYDASVKRPARLASYEKQSILYAVLQRAEANAQTEIVEFLRWEEAFLNLRLPPQEESLPYNGLPYALYAERYGLTALARDYARERANETRDDVLKLHYLVFLLLGLEPKGRTWIDLQREVLAVCRQYTTTCLNLFESGSGGHMGSCIGDVLRVIGRLMMRGVKKDEQPSWAEWLVDLAAKSMDFSKMDGKEFLRYRWAPDYLEHLAELSGNAVGPTLQSKVFAFLKDASDFYAADPLADVASYRVIEVEAKLQRHWGGGDKVHEWAARRKFDVNLRRAEFHQSNGDWFAAAHFFRTARQLVEEQRRFFSLYEVSRLQIAEQNSINQGLETGGLALFEFSAEFPVESMDYTQDTPELTVAELVRRAVSEIPSRHQLAMVAAEASKETPFLAMASRTLIAPGKVVGESHSSKGNLHLDVESRAMMQAQLFGAAVSNTVIRATEEVGLTPEHLVAPLGVLSLGDECLSFIVRGCERLMAQDFISATHILILRVEDVLRRYLQKHGVDTKEYRKDVGDGTSRTDDATFGSLMHKTLPDNSTVREHLGADLWEHLDSVLNSQTGLNLRNDIAHGLARPGQCTAGSAGIALALLYQLAHAERPSKRDASDVK